MDNKIKETIKDSIVDTVFEDLGNRDLSVVGFICKNKEGQFQFLSYNEKGLVYFMSQPVKAIDLYEKCEGSMIRPIATIAPQK